jgi:hypothetical protein
MIYTGWRIQTGRLADSYQLQTGRAGLPPPGEPRSRYTIANGQSDFKGREIHHPSPLLCAFVSDTTSIRRPHAQLLAGSLDSPPKGRARRSTATSILRGISRQIGARPIADCSRASFFMHQSTRRRFRGRFEQARVPVERDRRGSEMTGSTRVREPALSSDDDLKLMAERSTYFDPQPRRSPDVCFGGSFAVSRQVS